ncbi:MAG: hypothetical protein V3R82_02435 [Candidatus Hydrothermarchaeales archaeon]
MECDAVLFENEKITFYSQRGQSVIFPLDNEPTKKEGKKNTQ